MQSVNEWVDGFVQNTWKCAEVNQLVNSREIERTQQGKEREKRTNENMKAIRWMHSFRMDFRFFHSGSASWNMNWLEIIVKFSITKSKISFSFVFNEILFDGRSTLVVWWNALFTVNDIFSGKILFKIIDVSLGFCTLFFSSFCVNWHGRYVI